MIVTLSPLSHLSTVLIETVMLQAIPFSLWVFSITVYMHQNKMSHTEKLRTLVHVPS